MSESNAAARVVKYWQDRNIPFLPGVSATSLRSFEEANGVALPVEFRDLYLVTNGTFVPGFSGVDHHAFAFWNLESVRRDTEFPWAFVFADQREESWWFGIDPSGDGGLGRQSVYFLGSADRTPLIVARRFEEFIEAYLNDDERLYPSGAREHDRGERHRRSGT